MSQDQLAGAMKSLDMGNEPIKVSWADMVEEENAAWANQKEHAGWAKQTKHDEEHGFDKFTRACVLELKKYYEKHGKSLGYSESDLPFVTIKGAEDGEVIVVRPHRWASKQTSQFKHLQADRDVEFVTLTREIPEGSLAEPKFHARNRDLNKFTPRDMTIVPRSKVVELEKEGWRV